MAKIKSLIMILQLIATYGEETTCDALRTQYKNFDCCNHAKLMTNVSGFPSKSAQLLIGTWKRDSNHAVERMIAHTNAKVFDNIASCESNTGLRFDTDGVFTMQYAETAVVEKWMMETTSYTFLSEQNEHGLTPADPKVWNSSEISNGMNCQAMPEPFASQNAGSWTISTMETPQGEPLLDHLTLRGSFVSMGEAFASVTDHEYVYHWIGMDTRLAQINSVKTYKIHSLNDTHLHLEWEMPYLFANRVQELTLSWGDPPPSYGLALHPYGSSPATAVSSISAWFVKDSLV